jgi:alpha,alpha-trehalose phosphorylase
MALVYGLGGLRDFDGNVCLDPRLPREWNGHGCVSRCTSAASVWTSRSPMSASRWRWGQGPALEVAVRGERVKLDAGEPVSIGLGDRHE